MVKGARQREWPRHLSTHTRAEDLTHNVCSRGPIRYTSRLCIPHTHKHASTHSHTHTHTHTHTERTLPTTMSVLEAPFHKHVSTVYQTHTCMQAPIPTLCLPAKNTHNKRVKDSTDNVRPYAQVRYTSHLQSSYAVMRQLLFTPHSSFFSKENWGIINLSQFDRSTGMKCHYCPKFSDIP